MNIKADLIFDETTATAKSLKAYNTIEGFELDLNLVPAMELSTSETNYGLGLRALLRSLINRLLD